LELEKETQKRLNMKREKIEAENYSLCLGGGLQLTEENFDDPS
jgi:hypothetical protein